MSGAPHIPPGEGGAGADPSMEDILASIRRILNEDEVAPASPEAATPHAPPQAPPEPNAGGSGGSDDDGVLVLDEAMLVTPQPGPDVVHPTTAEFIPPMAVAAPLHEPLRPAIPELPPAIVEPPPHGASIEPRPQPALLAPESAAAASSAVGELLRTISAERSSQVHRGGPTIEDLVREEVRPLLKTWLDQHLPPLVERLVRQEIERVTGRAAP